jgi:hypothetical protein
MWTCQKQKVKGDGELFGHHLRQSAGGDLLALANYCCMN